MSGDTQLEPVRREGSNEQEDRDSEVDVVGESEAEEEYDVKRIIGKRVSSSEGVQYFIEWSGYPLSDSTWEEVENLRCPAAVIEFEVQLQQERKNNQPTEWFEDEGLVVMLQDARRLYKGVNVFNSYDEKGNLQPERKQRPGDLRKLTLRGGKPIKILDSIKDTNGRRFHLLKWQSGDKCWASVDRLPVPSRLIQNYEHKKFREERSKLIAHVLARKPSTLVRSKAGVDGGGALPVAHLEIDAVPQKANVHTEAGSDADAMQISDDESKHDILRRNILTKRNRKVLLESSSEDEEDNSDVTLLSGRAVVKRAKVVDSASAPLESPSGGSTADGGYLDIISDEEGEPTMSLLGVGEAAGIEAKQCAFCSQPELPKDTDPSLLLPPGENPPADAASGDSAISDTHCKFIQTCSKCGLECHPACFRQNLSRPLAAEEHSEPLSTTDLDLAALYRRDEWQCIYCNLWSEYTIDTLLTSRPEEGVSVREDWPKLLVYSEDNNDVSTPANADRDTVVTTAVNDLSGKNNHKYNVEAFRGHQFLVHFLNRSYRHLAWVPYIWLKQIRRHLIVAYARRLRGGYPPPRDSVVKQNWAIVERFYNAEWYDSNTTLKREEDFKERLTEARNEWAKDDNETATTGTATDSQPLRHISHVATHKRDPFEGLSSDLYSQVKALFVKWQGLDAENSVWDSAPNPFTNPNEYRKWSEAYTRWRDKLCVSGNTAYTNWRTLSSKEAGGSREFKELEEVPWYVGLGIKGALLFPHQLEGLNWLLYKRSKDMSCVLADDMGLGKTIQIISFIAAVYCSTIPSQALEMAKSKPSLLTTCNQGRFPFLVVCPNSLITNWLREFAIWAPFLVVEPFHGSGDSRELQAQYGIWNGSARNAVLPSTSQLPQPLRRGKHGKTLKDLNCHVVLCTYETLITQDGLKTLNSVPLTWEYLIVDEGHRLRNDQAKLFQKLNQLKVKGRILLTGTPLQNNIRELFTLLCFVDPRKFGDIDAFEQKYKALDKASIEEIHTMIRPHFLRRTKEQILSKLPPKHELIVPVSMTQLQRQMYRATLSKNLELLRSIQSAIQKNEGSEGGSVEGAKRRGRQNPRLHNLLMEIRKIINHPYMIHGVEPIFGTQEETHRQLVQASGKFKLLQILLAELRDRGHRVLIFSQFKRTLDIIEDMLYGEKYTYVRMDGDTSNLDRQRCVDDFNAQDSSIFAFLSTTRSGGVGLNLTSADAVIIFDPDWNPHMDIQALSRAYRIGQKKPVTVFKLMTKDSAEERIVRVGAKKMLLDHVLIETLGHENDQDEMASRDIETALRHGAELLFGENAEESASCREVVYNKARVDALLDECEKALKEAEKQRDTRFASADEGKGEHASARETRSFGFARVWEYESENKDVVADSDQISDSEEKAGFWEKVFLEQKSIQEAMNLARLEEYGRGRRKRTQTAKYSEVESQAKMDKSGKDIENPTADEKDELKDTDFVPMADHASDDDESVKDQDVDIISEGVVIASALPTTTTTAALVQSTQPLPQPPLMAPKPLVHSPLQGASAPQQAPSVIGGQHGTEPPPKVQHQPIQVPLSVSDDMSPQSKAELGVFFKSIIRKFYAMVSMKLSVGYKPMSEPENIFNTTVPMQEWNTSVGNSSFYLLSKCPICSRPGHRLDVCPAILNPDIVAMLKAMFRLKGAYQDSTMVALIDWYNSQYRLFHIRKRMSSNQGGGQLGMAPHKPANTTQIRPPHAAPTTPQSAATSRGNRVRPSTPNTARMPQKHTPDVAATMSVTKANHPQQQVVVTSSIHATRGCPESPVTASTLCKDIQLQTIVSPTPQPSAMPFGSVGSRGNGSPSAQPAKRILTSTATTTATTAINAKPALAPQPIAVDVHSYQPFSQPQKHMQVVMPSPTATTRPPYQKPLLSMSAATTRPVVQSILQKRPPSQPQAQQQQSQQQQPQQHPPPQFQYQQHQSPHPQPQHIQQGSGYILPGSNHAIVDKNALADIMRRLEQLEKGKQVQELRSDFNAINQNILNAQISNILQGNLATNPQQIQQLPLSATGSAVYSAAYNTPRQLYSQMATPSPIPPPVSSPAFTQQFTQNLGYVQHPQVSAGAYIVPQPLRPGFQASPQSSAQGVHLAAGSVSATSGFVHAPKYMHAPFGYNDGGETSKAVVTSTADIDPSSQAPGIKNQSSTSSPKLNSGITEVGSVNSSAAPRTPAEATNAHTAPTNNRDNMSLQSASYTLNGQNGIQQKKVPFFDMKCPLCMAGNHDPEICPNRFNAEALEQQYDRLLNSSLANTAKSTLLASLKWYIYEARKG